MGTTKSKKKPTAKAGKPRARKPATDAASAAPAGKATDAPPQPPGAKTGERGAKEHILRETAEAAAKVPPKLSCLDAAAKVLATAQEPLPCKEIIKLMRHDGLWTSDAATPHATLYAAMLREITKKGEASRFVKADRGRFQLRPAKRGAA